LGSRQKARHASWPVLLLFVHGMKDTHKKKKCVQI
jgi:hypothetical protein